MWFVRTLYSTTYCLLTFSHVVTQPHFVLPINAEMTRMKNVITLFLLMLVFCLAVEVVLMWIHLPWWLVFPIGFVAGWGTARKLGRRRRVAG
jgi:hypothetical protein